MVHQPVLHYAIPLKGVVRPVTYIHPHSYYCGRCYYSTYQGIVLNTIANCITLRLL